MVRTLGSAPTKNACTVSPELYALLVRTSLSTSPKLLKMGGLSKTTGSYPSVSVISVIQIKEPFDEKLRVVNVVSVMNVP